MGPVLNGVSDCQRLHERVHEHRHLECLHGATMGATCEPQDPDRCNRITVWPRANNLATCVERHHEEHGSPLQMRHIIIHNAHVAMVVVCPPHVVASIRAL